MTDRRSYTTRINRVIDHIDAHLAEPLGLSALATVAHSSPWHFHRVFQAFTGETLADRVRRRRLEVAANRLLASPRTSTLRIALEVGMGSAEAFTRSFKAHFGVTPSAWASRRRAHVDRTPARAAPLTGATWSTGQLVPTRRSLASVRPETVKCEDLDGKR
jgi:AraC-like DNA-binding protein